MGDEAAEKAWGTWYTNYAGSIDTTALHVAFMAGRASVHDTFNGLRSRIAELEAVNREALGIARSSSVPLGVPEGMHFEGLLRTVERVLAEAPSVVLDQMIREAKAEALEWAAERLEGNPCGDPGTALAQQDGAEFIRYLIGEVTD